MTSTAKGYALLALASLGLHNVTGFSQEAKERPKILVADKLVVSPGKTTLQLRGLKLDQVSAVRIESLEPPVPVTILKKEKIALPPQVEAKDGGDTQIEIEFVLPEKFHGQSISFLCDSAEGATAPYAVRVAGDVADEAEPNNGFATAQPLPIGSLVRGAIQQQRDVDAFQISVAAGQTIVAEVQAARHGSVLDGMLALYDERGQLVANADDSKEGRDPELQFTAAKAGELRLVLMDAHDRGGATHPYLLEIRSPWPPKK